MIITCGWYNRNVLSDLELNDVIQMRKPHPCGSTQWLVVRLGADIGLSCLKCQHRVLMTRRELQKKMKAIEKQGKNDTSST